MKTKQHNGFIGYGSTDAEAANSCQIISLLKGAYNASGFEGLENRRNVLAPWKPRNNSLHIKGIGYVTIKDGYINLGDRRVKVTSNLFEMLYKSFSSTLLMVDMLLCSTEIKEMFEANDIKVPDFSTYEQVIGDDVHMYDEDVVSNVILESYSIIFFTDNKVAMKRNSEELYWVCNFDPEISSILDTIYYLAYVRGYEGLEELLKEE